MMVYTKLLERKKLSLVRSYDFKAGRMRNSMFGILKIDAIAILLISPILSWIKTQNILPVAYPK